jgi:hypothetical protein
LVVERVAKLGADHLHLLKAGLRGKNKEKSQSLGSLKSSLTPLYFSSD